MISLSLLYYVVFFLIIFWKFSLFVCFWLCLVLIAVPRLSIAVASGGYSQVAVCRLLVVASLVAEHRLYAHGLQLLWHVGLVALWHVWSSWTRNRTCIPFIGRQTLNHWTTREVLSSFIFEIPFGFPVVTSTITPWTTYQVVCIFFTDGKVRESLGKHISLWRKRCCHVKQSIPDALRREKRCA